jgi:hypothetical protein
MAAQVYVNYLYVLCNSSPSPSASASTLAILYFYKYHFIERDSFRSKAQERFPIVDVPDQTTLPVGRHLKIP